MASIRYMTSLLTFYLKGEIETDQNFVAFKEPTTILGLIPMGSNTQVVPVDQIASTSVNTRLNFGRLLLGLILLIGAIWLMRFSFLLALLLFLIAACCIINAFEISLTLFNTAGQQKLIRLLIFEKGKADYAAFQINEMIANRLADTNLDDVFNRHML